ncbi:lantibiotic dehydratase [Streptomyces sp. NPDC051546]|uniref:lantibiotic dehydratase n=1 Tax=Streptomyces sp. NPDC051546 TaxID=3365655 RepID=UPI0037A823E8
MTGRHYPLAATRQESLHTLDGAASPQVTGGDRASRRGLGSAGFKIPSSGGCQIAGHPLPRAPAAHGPYFRAVPAALLRAPARGRLEGAVRTAPDGAPHSRADCVQVLRTAAGDAPLMEALHVARAPLSVVRHEARMRSRCTPFGLFAGVAPVCIGASAKVSWQDSPSSRARVDLDWLSRLVRALESDGVLLPQRPRRPRGPPCPRPRPRARLAPQKESTMSSDTNTTTDTTAPRDLLALPRGQILMVGTAPSTW